MVKLFVESLWAIRFSLKNESVYNIAYAEYRKLPISLGCEMTLNHRFSKKPHKGKWALNSNSLANSGAESVKVSYRAYAIRNIAGSNLLILFYQYWWLPRNLWVYSDTLFIISRKSHRLWNQPNKANTY